VTTAFVDLKIQRRDSAAANPRWEEFRVPYVPGMNVISCLLEIRRNPVTRDGRPTTPPVWEASCLEEVCGACSMVINGTPRQACAALVENLKQPIELRPLTKFPVVRDLMVDRAKMFAALKRVKAWIPIDGTYDLGPGPRLSAGEQEYAYLYARCMTCGCCMEACPQYHGGSEFIGPAPLAQVELFNIHPTGAMNRAERLEQILGPGGITDCGKAENCVQVCPKEIPLTDALSNLYRAATGQWIKGLFRK